MDQDFNIHGIPSKEKEEQDRPIIPDDLLEIAVYWSFYTASSIIDQAGSNLNKFQIEEVTSELATAICPGVIKDLYIRGMPLVEMRAKYMKIINGRVSCISETVELMREFLKTALKEKQVVIVPNVMLLEPDPEKMVIDDIMGSTGHGVLLDIARGKKVYKSTTNALRQALDELLANPLIHDDLFGEPLFEVTKVS